MVASKSQREVCVSPEGVDAARGLRSVAAGFGSVSAPCGELRAGGPRSVSDRDGGFAILVQSASAWRPEVCRATPRAIALSLRDAIERSGRAKVSTRMARLVSKSGRVPARDVSKVALVASGVKRPGRPEFQPPRSGFVSSLEVRRVASRVVPERSSGPAEGGEFVPLGDVIGRVLSSLQKKMPQQVEASNQRPLVSRSIGSH